MAILCVKKGVVVGGENGKNGEGKLERGSTGRKTGEKIGKNGEVKYGTREGEERRGGRGKGRKERNEGNQIEGWRVMGQRVWEVKENWDDGRA